MESCGPSNSHRKITKIFEHCSANCFNLNIERTALRFVLTKIKYFFPKSFVGDDCKRFFRLSNTHPHFPENSY